MKFFLFFLFLVFFNSVKSQNIIVLEGVNTGRNLIVQNPFSSTGVGFCIQKVTINGVLTDIEINGSVFEIDFARNNVNIGEKIIVEIHHKKDCSPKIYNPEVVMGFGNDSINNVFSDGQYSNYSLADKSICIIKGKIIYDEDLKTRPHLFIELNNKTMYHKYYGEVGSPDSRGEYIALVKFDDLYELTVYNSQTGEVAKKILIDLRGVPEEKKRGQVINVDIKIDYNVDKRLMNLNEKFPVNKLVYNVVTRSLTWDEDYSNAIITATSILTEQIEQEKDLEKIKIEDQLKQIQLEKNENDLIQKNNQLEEQKNTLKAQELEKKERENELRDNENKLNEELAQKRNLMIIVGIVFLFAATSLYAFLRQRRLKNLLNEEKNIAEKQKEQIQEAHQEIKDSINYAERIQRSFMASEFMLNASLKDYFVYFNPKEAVSGDFYWAGNLNNGNFVLCCADSTGHGVPGAIMSILNISSIEKAIENGKILPADIFNYTRRSIIERLKKDGSKEGGKDGMDASLVILNPDKTVLEYVAAHNPVWIIRNGELIEIEAEKMPVGKHERDNIPFVGGKMLLERGDVIYLMTDGFQDQFGGEKGKKFKVKKLKEKLTEISNLTMSEQRTVIAKTFSDWVGNLEQVDDVCIIGLRV